MKIYFPLITACLVMLGSISCLAQMTNPSDFLVEGYTIFEKYYGDLNKDGLEDCIIITKGTDKKELVINRFDKEVDRNRRGIIILFKNNDHYELVCENYNCFLSENEDGGVYYPPEMSLIIEKGNLYVHYTHGRYGYWKYTFRNKNDDFELIGYDSTQSYGPIINNATSFNFLTKKKLFSENINEDSDEGGDEVFKDTWSNFELDELIKLSEIGDFEEFYIADYIK